MLIGTMTKKKVEAAMLVACITSSGVVEKMIVIEISRTNTWAKSYKTFYVCNLQMFVIN
jgi:hypothetical protein